MAKRLMTRLPVTLLVRRIVNEKPVWLLHGQHLSMEAAAATYNDRIRGRGITAWAWWGPTRVAKKMLLDPSYEEPAVMETRTTAR
jgi:hypothetical protein